MLPLHCAGTALRRCGAWDSTPSQRGGNAKRAKGFPKARFFDALTSHKTEAASILRQVNRRAGPGHAAPRHTLTALPCHTKPRQAGP